MGMQGKVDVVLESGLEKINTKYILESMGKKSNHVELAKESIVYDGLEQCSPHSKTQSARRFQNCAPSPQSEFSVS